MKKELNYDEILIEVKNDEYKENLLRLIAIFRYIPINYILLMEIKLFEKEWKLKEAIKFLKAQNVIKCLAIDCDVKHNEKDTFTTTKRGFQIMKDLGITPSDEWESFGQSPSLARSRCVCSLTFVGTQKFFHSVDLTKPRNDETKEDVLQFKGSKVAGFYITKNVSFSVYSFSHPISVSFSKEIRCNQRVLKLTNRNLADYSLKNRLDRIIVAESPTTVIELLEIRNGKLWLYQNKEYKRCSISKSVFTGDKMNSEIVRRKYGTAYLVPVVEGVSDYIKNRFKSPIKKELALRNELLQLVNNESKLNTYRYAIAEDENGVVFDLRIINLYTLYDVVSAIKKDNKSILCFVDVCTKNFIEEILKHFAEKYKFGFDIYYRFWKKGGSLWKKFI